MAIPTDSHNPPTPSPLSIESLTSCLYTEDGVLCTVSPGLTVWPMGGVGDGVRWPELPNSVRWGEGEGPERGREAEKEGKRGR